MFDITKEIAELKIKTDTLSLSFSLGKDSLVSWILLKDHFKIIPTYFYIIPELEFIKKQIDYYEDFFCTKINLSPHPILFDMLYSGYFQYPHNYHIFEKLEFEHIDFTENSKQIWYDCNLDDNSFWQVVSIKKSDSAMRRLKLMKTGVLDHQKKIFYPIADIKKNEQIKIIKDSKVKISQDYEIWGRSFDGIDIYFLKHLKEYFPNDFEKIKNLFPLIEVEFFRSEINEKIRG